MSWIKTKFSISKGVRHDANTTQQWEETQKCYSNCLLWTAPVHWMRQGQRAPWHTKTHTQLNQIALESAGGMNISRHWSRHAFRDIPKAQYTFKSLLVHGILQFTMLITLRCALHRCSSRDIRRWKLYSVEKVEDHQERYADTLHFKSMIASQQRKTVLSWSTTRELVRAERDKLSNLTQKLIKEVHSELSGCVWMILPQVHLRKPCYDFSFL